MTRQDRISSLLHAALSPILLSVEDESGKHHAPGAETHMKISMVSPVFEGLSLVARHRQVHDLVTDEFAAGLHALSLHLRAPSEWKGGPLDQPSPPCRGGSRVHTP